MRVHITIIAWLHIALGLLFVLTSIALSTVSANVNNQFIEVSQKINSQSVSGSTPTGPSGLQPATVNAQPSPFNIMNIAPKIMMVLGFVVGVPGIIAGVGLLRLESWGRILGIIVSILDIITFNPLYLALGVYGLVILLNKESEPFFNRTMPPMTDS